MESSEILMTTTRRLFEKANLAENAGCPKSTDRRQTNPEDKLWKVRLAREHIHIGFVCSQRRTFQTRRIQHTHTHRHARSDTGTHAHTNTHTHTAVQNILRISANEN